MSDVLLDANYLIALAFPGETKHEDATYFAETTEHTLLTPTIVLTEAIYFLRRLGGVRAVMSFGDLMRRDQMQLLPLTQLDFDRALEIMQIYADADLDFVDSCITAMAERLNIRHICTFDRRDFSIIRPKHVDYFTLLP